MNSRRQHKVAQLILETLSQVFQKNGSTYYGGAFVTITDVDVSPDLLVAKVYLSIYNVENKEDYIDRISSHAHEVRRLVGNSLKHSLKRIPEFLFYLDNSLDEALKIEGIIKGENKSEPNEE